ncbi:MAG: pyridoxal phosphate-dependent aminotransferase family protein [Crocinitomicaceae bacterium]|nr:pyridoxal phosphate-dependent aminotransferase family protein [Crocinitomicaceae bacterium]
MDQKLKNKLSKRIEKGTLRSLSHFEGYTDFFSNDYLGLAKEKTEPSSDSFGGTGSRLISGTTKEILNSEAQIASFFNAEAGLMFNSGYDANLGIFSAIPQRGDTIIYDELIHASVRDGMRLSFAGNQSFKHNDLIDLEKKIKKASGTIYVAVESLYSMDGDLASLSEINQICKKYNAYLIVDEAHAAGIFGDQGKGLVNDLNLETDVFARLVTFGKAYGSHGGCVLGSKELIQFVSNFARSFIYTTALPEYVYQRNAQLISLDLLEERRKNLVNNLHLFRSQLIDDRLISNPNSPIQIFQIGDIDETQWLAEKLLENKIAVKPIYSPTVAVGTERLRLCLHSFNTEEQIGMITKILMK